MGIKDLVELRVVSNDDLEFLYNMLKERDETMTIFHKTMPTFEEHVKFVMSKPYDAWYIILVDSRKIGHIYINNFQDKHLKNQVGWWIKKEYQGVGFVIPAFTKLKQMHERSKYVATINPKNKPAIYLIEKLGFKLTITYPNYLLYELDNQSDINS